MKRARPEVEPVEVDARWIIAGGTIAWLIALVLLGTVFHDALARHHATWWLWSCGIGAVLGAYGYSFVARRRPKPADPADPADPAERDEPAERAEVAEGAEPGEAGEPPSP